MKRELIMEIMDAFFITGKGAVVTGKIQNERIAVGQKIIIDLESLPELETEIKSIELVNFPGVKVAFKNEVVGIVLANVEQRIVSALRQKKVYLL